MSSPPGRCRIRQPAGEDLATSRTWGSCSQRQSQVPRTLRQTHCGQQAHHDLIDDRPRQVPPSISPIRGAGPVMPARSSCRPRRPGRAPHRPAGLLPPAGAGPGHRCWHGGCRAPPCHPPPPPAALARPDGRPAPGRPATTPARPPARRHPPPPAPAGTPPHPAAGTAAPAGHSGPPARQHPRRGIGGPLADRGKRPRPGQHRRHRGQQQRRQRVPHPAWITRVRHPGQIPGQAGALASQHRPVPGRQIPQLLQGRAAQR